jgi:hypothetical protein
MCVHTHVVLLILAGAAANLGNVNDVTSVVLAGIL